MSEHSAARPAVDNELLQRMITQVATSNAHLTFISSKVEQIEKNMNERVDRFEKRILGNGQPGELDRIRAEAKEQAGVVAAQGIWITRADEREKVNRSWTVAIGSLAGTLFGSAAAAVIEWLKHRK